MTALELKYDRANLLCEDDSMEEHGERTFHPRVVDAETISLEQPIDFSKRISTRYDIGLGYLKLCDLLLKQKVDSGVGYVLPVENYPGDLLDYAKYFAGSLPISESTIEPLQEISFSAEDLENFCLPEELSEPEDGDSELQKDFDKLATVWYQETRKLSSADQMVFHPAYQKIIGMGKDALPLIFRELKKTRGHWIWALAMILRDDKAKPGMRFREAVDAWLAWGKSNGYI